MSRDLFLSGREVSFGENELIVSKTDQRGRITYCNGVFRRVAGFGEEELLGAPHSIIRHPDMPRCVFKLLWDTLEAGDEIFAYVVNRCKNGDEYWVYAHVTPSYDEAGNLIGYHSNRRVPRREAVDVVKPLYRQLVEIENGAADRKQGMAQSFAAMVDLLRQKGVSYDRFVLGL